MIKDICNHGLLRTICRKCSGSMTNLDKIDLELFKVCYPKCKIYYTEYDEEHKYPEFIPSGKPLRTHRIDLRSVPQFTKDIAVCFSVLIPEMNKGGFVPFIEQYSDDYTWHAAFYSETRTCEATDAQPQIAICLAAIKTLSKTDSTLHKNSCSK